MAKKYDVGSDEMKIKTFVGLLLLIVGSCLFGAGIFCHEYVETQVIGYFTYVTYPYAGYQDPLYLSGIVLIVVGLLFMILKVEHGEVKLG